MSIELSYLHGVVDTIEHERLRLAARNVLFDSRFQEWPASCKHHHVYSGGLVVHTKEVLEYALASAVPLPINKPVLIAAAVFHDYAKIYDYEKKDGKWQNAPYRDSIRHVSGSHAEFVRAVQGIIDTPTQRAVEHCILAHHGRPEWGSPVEPKTVEALLLHQADMVSAMYGARR